MSKTFTKFSQAFDLGVVTTSMICVTLTATYVMDQFTTADLRLPLRVLDMICVVALLIWQFRRIQQNRLRDRLQKAILDAVPHILFFKDARLRYRQINTAFEETFDVKAEGVQGLSDRDLFGEELHRRFRLQDFDLLQHGRVQTYDEEMLVKGEIRQIQSSKRPVYDQDGGVIGIVGLAIDVTDQNRLQQELRDAHARLNVALKAARMGVWEWDLDTGQVQVDEVARGLLRLQPGDHHADAVFLRMHPEDVERVRTLARSALNAKEPVEFEFRVIDDEGAEHWLEGFAASPGNRNYLIGVNRDITERRRSKLALDEAKTKAERALAELEQSRIDLGLALGAGGLGVWRSENEIDNSDSIIQPAFLAATFSADENVVDICGFDAGVELTYGNYIQSIHPDDREHAINTLSRIDREGTHVYRDQYRVTRPDGGIRTLDVRGIVTILPSSIGKLLVSITGIAKDVTDEEALKAKLAAKAEEARLARDAKSRFLAMMSHEVRTPMNGVLGMLDLVIDTPLTSDQQHMLSRCRSSAQALLTIVNDILDFSKIEAGKLDIESTPLSLRSLIEDACSAFYAQASQKHVGLTTEVDNDIPRFVLGDPVRLRQILTNLVNNAIKFTSRGQVRVRAFVCDPGRWALEVHDSGPGISVDVLAQLFQPFQQADATTTRRFGGTGLGLSIVKQLAELMGGTVECSSEEGKGSRFCVVLPLRAWLPTTGATVALDSIDAGSRRRTYAATRPSDPDLGGMRTANAEPTGHAASSLSPKRFLVAEDNPINQEIIVRQLAKLGHACDWAEDGEQAWTLLQASGAAYDALITDGNMPHLDGYGLTERIRDWERRQSAPRLPILAMTANALQGERERCLALGMDGYLSKPLDLAQLQWELFRLFPSDGDSAVPFAFLDSAVPEAERQYAAVREIFDSNPEGLVKLLTTFVMSLGEDIALFELAHRKGDAGQLRSLAHKMGSGCLQLDEINAQQALQLVEDAVNLEVALQACPKAVAEVHAVLSRARLFLEGLASEEGMP